MADCQLCGLEHPGGHHLTNILLHVASAILLFLVLRQMTGDLWPSAFAATLFAIHPLHVESVAWVAERKDVLSGLFFMLTLAAYTGYARHPFSLFRYLLVTALFALGLMAKPMLVTLPFVLLLLDYWPLGRVDSGRWTVRSRTDRQPLSTVHHPPSNSFVRLFLEKLPWLVLSAASCVVTYEAQGAAVATFQSLPFHWRIAGALVSYIAYLGQFFYPAGLAVFYPHLQDAPPLGEIVGSGLLLAGISLAVLALCRKCPCLLVGWLWYLGMLVPVIGLVQVGSQAMADRYTYLTQIGLYIALVWGAAHLFTSWTVDGERWTVVAVSVHRPPSTVHYLGAAVSALLLAGLMICAWQQASYWKDDVTLWPHVLACTSNNYVAHSVLGDALARRGQVDEAIVQYQAALRIKSDYAEAHTNLADALVRRGRIDEAIAHYRTALTLKPDHPAALNNLAWLRATHPDPKYRDGRQAVILARRAVELASNNPSALDTLAAAYAEAGRFAEAVETARQALDLALQQNKQSQAESIRSTIRLYQAGTPFHEPGP